MKKTTTFILFILTLALTSCETQSDITLSNQQPQAAFSKADYLGTWRYHFPGDTVNWFPIVISDSVQPSYANVLFPFTNNKVYILNTGNWSTVTLPRQEIWGYNTAPDPQLGCAIVGSIFLNSTKDSLTVLITRKDWNFYAAPDTTTSNSPYNDGFHPDRVVAIR